MKTHDILCAFRYFKGSKAMHLAVFILISHYYPTIKDELQARPMYQDKSVICDVADPDCVQLNELALNKINLIESMWIAHGACFILSFFFDGKIA